MTQTNGDGKANTKQGWKIPAFVFVCCFAVGFGLMAIHQMAELGRNNNPEKTLSQSSDLEAFIAGLIFAFVGLLVYQLIKFVRQKLAR